jgi:putative toxin-antitoxin system antitoxin component (TIGR02293 family)
MAQQDSETSRIVEVLGGERLLGLKSSSFLALEECERSGFPTEVVKTLLQRSVLSPSEVFDWIVPRRTFAHRVERHQRLNLEESNRVARVARIYAITVDTLGDREKAARWLRRPIRQFAGRSPMEMLRTETGARQVEDLLGRISHGIAA